MIAVRFVLCVIVSLICARAKAEPARAHELEGRLFAPCCYVQTLDTHESELASALRAEIRERLAGGEAPQRIEDDLVHRYGERIRAVPRGRDPRGMIPFIVGIAMALAAMLLVTVGLRSMRRRRDAERVEPPPTAGDVSYDAALDDELRRFDEA